MAKYRMIRVSFWEDPRVLEEMTPEDKYFYIYLMTNPNTTQIGIYELTKKKIAFETGYSFETVQVLMDRFENIHKLIKYNKETREIALLNWPKYNLASSGKPILDCVNAELSVVKDFSLISLMIDSIPNENIRNIFQSYLPMDFDEPYNEPSTVGGQKEKEKEKEKEKKEILSGKPNEILIPFDLIVNHLNKAANTSFRSSSKNTQKHIRARWKEGYRLDDFLRVIELKVTQWINDSKMAAYLRPDTLFGTKFESYLNERGGNTSGQDGRNFSQASRQSESILKGRTGWIGRAES